jgi:hypothetical protein
MRKFRLAGVLAIALSTAGCGGEEPPEPEEEPMKVEDTVFGDLVGTQDKARDGANQAVDVHRKALEQRLGEDEGAPPES